MQLTKAERIFIATTHRDIKNVSGAVRLFQDHFQERSVSRIIVRRNVIKFSTYMDNGTIVNKYIFSSSYSHIFPPVRKVLTLIK